MTKLYKWYEMKNEGETHSTYTEDSWVIPEEGTEIWCTAWKRAQTIRPCGDEYHIYVGFSIYHCDEFMEILDRLEKDGYKWGIDGVKVVRKQYQYGHWHPVDIK